MIKRVASLKQSFCTIKCYTEQLEIKFTVLFENGSNLKWHSGVPYLL